MGGPSLCPCEISIPLAYNDGRQVSKALLFKYLKVFDRQFGGWRELGTHQGSWHGQVEMMLAIEVDVMEEQIDLLRKIVQAVGHELGQEKMYFKRGSPSVELLDPDASAGLIPG